MGRLKNVSVGFRVFVDVLRELNALSFFFCS